MNIQRSSGTFLRMTPLSRRRGRAFALTAYLLCAALSIFLTAGMARATTSSNVAYVFDFGAGSNDTIFLGSSIFVNALTGVTPSGFYTTADTTLTVAITDVAVSTIDANPSTALSGFDTIILYQVCDIASHPNTMTAINNFLLSGGKLMIFDADGCSSISMGQADYSTFLFPFTASTPGPLGAGGSYTLVESSTLTTGLAVGSVPGDAVGDANTFITFDPAWCASITATNAAIPPNTGFVEAYARTPNALPGLVIYEGEDFWFTFGPDPHLRLVFDDMLEQPFNPDNLPCSLPASLITLAPATQTVCPSGPATVTATVKDFNGNSVPGVTVTFTVTSGPNAGVSGTATTDASGNASFGYSGIITVGTDVVEASFVDSLGNAHDSNTMDVVWQCPPVALCKDVKVNADSTCYATASIDNSSFDPDGEPVTLSQVPTTFILGVTNATLTVTDPVGLTASCTGNVTVVDITPPTVSCVQSVNPSDKNIPAAGNNPRSGQNPDGFYEVSASDNCSVSITIGTYTLANEETIKITQRPGQSGVTLVNTTGLPAIKHFLVGPGDAMITATDGSGNMVSVSCKVPPPPK
jgi:hypothetical protein